MSYSAWFADGLHVNYMYAARQSFKHVVAAIGAHPIRFLIDVSRTAHRFLCTAAQQGTNVPFWMSNRVDCIL
jgi:hypothetical protein